MDKSGRGFLVESTASDQPPYNCGHERALVFAPLAALRSRPHHVGLSKAQDGCDYVRSATYSDDFGYGDGNPCDARWASEALPQPGDHPGSRGHAFHSRSNGEIRLKRLEHLARACSNGDEFAALLLRAKEAGTTYREGLESVIREQSGGSD